MPSLTFDILLSRIHHNVYDYPIFVETGTFVAETILDMEPHFRSLHTIELSRQLHQMAREKYHGIKIQFHHGNSPEVLSRLMPELNDNAIFFLDAHYSGGDTSRANIDVPIHLELESIRDEFPHKAIIIIDDYRLFRTKDSDIDWTGVDKDSLVAMMGDRVTEVYHFESPLHPEDRLVIHIREGTNTHNTIT